MFQTLILTVIGTTVKSSLGVLLPISTRRQVHAKRRERGQEPGTKHPKGSKERQGTRKTPVGNGERDKLRIVDTEGRGERCKQQTAATQGQG